MGNWNWVPATPRESGVGDRNVGVIHMEMSISFKWVDVLPRKFWEIKEPREEPRKHEYLWSKWKRRVMKGDQEGLQHRQTTWTWWCFGSQGRSNFQRRKTFPNTLLDKIPSFKPGDFAYYSLDVSAAAAAALLQSCPTLCNPTDGSPQAPLSLGFSRQEHWSGLPFPFPVHKSESEVTQSCLTPRDPMDCSLPGSSVHGIFQARVLEWGAIAFYCILFLSWDSCYWSLWGSSSVPPRLTHPSRATHISAELSSQDTVPCLKEALSKCAVVGIRSKPSAGLTACLVISRVKWSTKMHVHIDSIWAISEICPTQGIHRHMVTINILLSRFQSLLSYKKEKNGPKLKWLWFVGQQWAN